MLRNNWDFNPAFFSSCFGTSSLLNKTKRFTSFCKRSLVNPTGCPCSNQNLINGWSGPVLWKTKPCCCKCDGNSQGQPEASRPDQMWLKSWTNQSTFFSFTTPAKSIETYVETMARNRSLWVCPCILQNRHLPQYTQLLQWKIATSHMLRMYPCWDLKEQDIDPPHCVQG